MLCFATTRIKREKEKKKVSSPFTTWPFYNLPSHPVRAVFAHRVTLLCGCAQVYRILYTYILLRTLCACQHVMSHGETCLSVPDTCTNTIMALWKLCFVLNQILLCFNDSVIFLQPLFFPCIFCLCCTIDAFHSVCSCSIIILTWVCVYPSHSFYHHTRGCLILFFLLWTC